MTPAVALRRGRGGSATANIDGGSRGNPGPAGYGVRIEQDDGTIVELKESHRHRAPTTSPSTAGCWRRCAGPSNTRRQPLHIRSDSELLVKQMRGEYRVKNPGLQPLYEEARALMRRIGRVTFEHVRREFNKDADRLANEAMDEGASSNSTS